MGGRAFFSCLSPLLTIGAKENSNGKKEENAENVDVAFAD
jgi:hypothetical protein